MQPLTFDVPRAQYDPGDAAPSPTRTLAAITGFELHHSGGPGPRSLSFADKRAWILGHERFHEEVKGWKDIFYNVYVFADGEIWEGRPATTQSQANLAQWLTVHVPGNSAPITEQQHRSLLEVVRLVTSSPGRIRGHGDRASTQCPGASGRAEVQRLQKEIITMSLPPIEIVPEDLGVHEDFLNAVKAGFISDGQPGRVASRSVAGVVAWRAYQKSVEDNKILTSRINSLHVSQAAQQKRIAALEAQVAKLGKPDAAAIEAVIDEIQKRLEE